MALRARAAMQAPPANEDPDRKEWREERDLRAQRHMALWAMWMFIATAAGVIATGVGLLYVIRAYNLNAEATRHAATAAKAATESANSFVRAERPHFMVDKIELSGVDLSAFRPVDPSPAGVLGTVRRKRGPYVTVDMTNYGKSPAILRSVVAELSLGPLPQSPDYSRADARQASIVAPGKQFPIMAFLDDGREMTDDEIDSAASIAGEHLRLVLCVEYTDVFGGRHVIRQAHKYIVANAILKRGGAGEGWWLKDGEPAYWEYS